MLHLHPLAGRASPCFAYDLSQIPLHPKATVQPKLRVGLPGNVYEQEADRVSEQIMRMPEPPLQRADAGGGERSKFHAGQLARKHDHQETEQSGSGGLGQIAVPPIINEVLSSPGQPLDAATRSFMGPRFGYDFSKVRVHTDQLSARSAESVAAHAYTVGRDVVFAAGRYAPATRDGQGLLAHELTHVVQQGGVGGPSCPAQDVAAEPSSEAMEMGREPKVRTRSPIGLAAQPNPAETPFQTGTLGPMGEIQPDPLVTSSLGLRIVDPSEIEVKMRRIVLAAGGSAAACKADFSASPRATKANLEGSRWHDDNERLLYARCYFEQDSITRGEPVDSEKLVRDLVEYEVKVQRQSADLVLNNPPTPEDYVKLAVLRKHRAAAARERASFESPLAKARANFVSNQEFAFRYGAPYPWHGKSQLFAPYEIEKAADAVIMATRDSSNAVPLAFFEYYSDHMLVKMDADEEKKATANGKDDYAHTDPGGDTRLRSDVTSFPEGRLGPILLHELGHTNDVESVVGLGDFQEGHGYAVEYFFSKDVERKAKIVELLSGDTLVIANQKPACHRLFYQTVATLVALTEVIQHGSSPHLPATLRPDTEMARRLIAERVKQSAPSSDELAAITLYVTGHLEAFDLPRL